MSDIEQPKKPSRGTLPDVKEMPPRSRSAHQRSRKVKKCVRCKGRGGANFGRMSWTSSPCPECGEWNHF